MEKCPDCDVELKQYDDETDPNLLYCSSCNDEFV